MSRSFQAARLALSRRLSLLRRRGDPEADMEGVSLKTFSACHYIDAVRCHDTLASPLELPETIKMTSDLTQLIHRVESGDQSARDALFATAYPELRKLARSRLYDGGRNTYLATTALVHESYLRFLKSEQLRLDDRRAFFAYASKVMRSVVIDSVREHQAQRRGGDHVELTLHTQFAGEAPSGEAEIFHIHEALLALEAAEPGWPK